MKIVFEPVAIVKNTRTEPFDDHWATVISEIELLEHIPVNAFENIEAFSHAEIIFYFHKIQNVPVIFSGHPRENPDYPVVGIFAQRKKNRPNAIGLCTVELLEHAGRKIIVKYLDAINGTPVLDIKPVIKEFEPKGIITQPEWADDLMKNYWT